MHVADAWPPWRNVVEAVESTVGSHHGCIQAAFAAATVVAEAIARDLVTPESSRPLPMPFGPPDGTLDVSGQPQRPVARTTERYAAVQALLAKGKSLALIGRTLRLDHSAVRGYARAVSLDELQSKATGRRPCWTSNKPHLHARWMEGCHDIPRLHRVLPVPPPLLPAPSDLPANQDGSGSRPPGRSPDQPRSAAASPCTPWSTAYDATSMITSSCVRTSSRWRDPLPTSAPHRRAGTAILHSRARPADCLVL